MATAAEPELKTYWCHECDMSVSLTSSSPSPSPLLCPHCHTHFLELMDSPFPQNDAVPFPSLLFDSPQNDVEDLIHFVLLHSPSSKTTPPKQPPSIPVISATASLLSQLDLNGVVFCAVCKDEIGINVDAKQLPCQHLYHSECITPWLELHSSCPLCRFQLVAEEEEGEEDDEIRRQLRAAMVMLSELTEGEEGEDLYGLRTTLNHIASRHGLIHGNGGEVEGLRLPDRR